MLMTPWTHITNFGDSACMVPAAAVVAALLWAGGARRAALLWLLTLTGGAAIVAVSKMAFLGWGIGIAAWDFTGISGHAMLATYVFIGTADLVTRSASPGLRVTALALAAGGAVAVAISRLALGVHSIPEIAAGCLLGAVTVFGFVQGTRGDRPLAFSRTKMAMALLTVMIVLHGEQAPAQQWLAAAAIRLSGHAQPYARPAWRTVASQSDASRI
jgi:membrane-associated phospholipid phosphatase